MAASLLFAPSGRPDVSAIAALAQSCAEFSVSFAPAPDSPREASRSGADAGGEHGPLRWVELLASGLTFDLMGLAPGSAAPSPPEAHRFGLDLGEAPEHLEAITLHPGPHLSGGARMLPVIRSLARLTALLAALPGVRAVAWHPARCWSAPEPFRESVLRWVDGGAFPAFALAALMPSDDGSLQSEGLALFTGQELLLEPELAGDRAAAGKIGVRLLHWLVEHGSLAAAESLTSHDGSGLRLEPSANGRFVKVWKD